MHFTVNKKSGTRVALLLFFLITLPQLGACQSKEEKLLKALEACKNRLEKDDLEALSLCYMKLQSDYPNQTERILKAGADDMAERCDLHINSQRYREASICYYGLTGLLPNSAVVYLKLAESFMEMYKADELKGNDLINLAEKNIVKSLELDTNYAYSHYIYAEILMLLRRNDKALSEINKAIKNEPEDKLFLVTKARYLTEIADSRGVGSSYYHEAIGIYKEALRIDSKLTFVHYDLGLLYEKTGQTDKAIESFEKLLQIENPYDDAEARLEYLKKRVKKK